MTGSAMPLRLSLGSRSMPETLGRLQSRMMISGRRRRRARPGRAVPSQKDVNVEAVVGELAAYGLTIVVVVLDKGDTYALFHV